MSTPLSVLRDVFGYESFRGDQARIIDRVVAGQNAIVLMPTGGGKSLCYQIPALCRDGVGVVVSPLIALMQDQVAALTAAGVQAAFLNSSLSFDEARGVIQQARRGALDLLYVAPERLLTDQFLGLLGELQIALFAIDEAHCVSQWGHDFRPEYMQLQVLQERFPRVPKIALTATADGPTRREIQTRLYLDDAEVFVGSFDRPNIRYWVRPKETARSQLKEFVKSRAGESGIVYCLSRKRVEEVARFLSDAGVRAVPYHAGLSSSVREKHQMQFVRDEVDVVVATVAFGMGIDKPDVRYVFHYDPPKSIEAYYQETGRAGRDGLPADAELLFSTADIARNRQLLMSDDADRARVDHKKLDALLGYLETATCRRKVLLAYFGQTLDEDCGNCDTCLEPKVTYDGTVEAQKVMSAIARTGQMFGQAHVIDVLVGKATDKVKSKAHDQLPTFGVGQDRPAKSWRHVIRQLVAQGLVVVDVEGYGALKLSGAARPVLQGERAVELCEMRKTVSKKKRAVADSLDDEADLALFEALRKLRKELADAQGMPPYVVFPDKTLIDLCQRRPTSLAEMSEVHGVGQVKLDRYGEAFVDVVRSHAG